MTSNTVKAVIELSVGTGLRNLDLWIDEDIRLTKHVNLLWQRA